MDAASLSKAKRHLARHDEVLRALIQRVGPCTLRADEDHFGVLARSIISQQISTKAAHAISARLSANLRALKPRMVLRASDELLRSSGLSQGKARSLRDLAQRCADGLVPLKKLAGLNDAEVAACLTQVHGIGPWTADMFLIFSLGRLDVLPVGDYGLRAGARKLYALADLPGKKELERLAECWQPYRSVGTWYVWRSFGAVPQSD